MAASSSGYQLLQPDSPSAILSRMPVVARACVERHYFRTEKRVKPVFAKTPQKPRKEELALARCGCQCIADPGRRGFRAPPVRADRPSLNCHRKAAAPPTALLRADV